MKKQALFTSVLAFLDGCAYTSSYNQIKPVSSGSSTGYIDTYEIGQEINYQYEIVGSLWLGETGFSTSCGYEDALYHAREKTREVGADAIMV